MELYSYAFLLSLFLPHSVIQHSVTERSRSERCPTKPKHWDLAPYGQKSFKIESNRSNRVLCLICCYLLDFSRSDLSFMPVIERQPKCGIPMKTIMVALLRLRSATDIANHRTKPKIQAPYGQKSFKIESNRSNRVLCLIYCYLLDFSRSDSFCAINFRLLSGV